MKHWIELNWNKRIKAPIFSKLELKQQYNVVIWCIKWTERNEREARGGKEMRNLTKLQQKN